MSSLRLPVSLARRSLWVAPGSRTISTSSVRTRRLQVLQRPGQRVFPASSRQPVRGFSHHAQVTLGDKSICIHSPEAVKRTELPNIWLRDNCRCESCVNQDTSQRNFDTFEIPADVHPLEVRTDEQSLHVTWSDGRHQSSYPWDFIRFYQTHDHRSPEPVEFHYWGRSIEQDPPSVAFEAVMDAKSEDGIAKLTDLIRRYGFAFVHDTPFASPDDTERLLERIAFIRVTHYGGFYDFIPDLAMADTAYTNLALPAHTDTTYFTDPAGLQAFHLLSHYSPPEAQVQAQAQASGSERLGGESLLVDSFHAAHVLQAEDPAAYDVLTRVRLPWHASGNQGITIAPDRRYPVLEVVDDGDCEAPGSSGGRGGRRLHRVRWNNDDRGIVPFGGPDADGIDPEQWYDAARKWVSILRRPDIEYWTQLAPGKVLVFDNWRVMHGRSAFVGQRRICGGYTARDDFISRWRNTNYPREQVLKQVVG